MEFFIVQKLAAQGQPLNTVFMSPEDAAKFGNQILVDGRGHPLAKGVVMLLLGNAEVKSGFIALSYPQRAMLGVTAGNFVSVSKC